MTQLLIVYFLLGSAIFYLLYKFVYKRMKNKKEGGKDCDNCP